MTTTDTSTHLSSSAQVPRWAVQARDYPPPPPSVWPPLLIALVAVIVSAALVIGTILLAPGLNPAPKHATTPRSFGAIPINLDSLHAYMSWQDGVRTAQVTDYLVSQAKIEARTHGFGAPGSRCGDDFECFKTCTLAHESDSAGGYVAISPGGKYRGAWQFDQSTWDSNAAAIGRDDLVGQDPATVAPGDQDAVARGTWEKRGNGPWGGRC